MPRYHYACEECGHEFRINQNITDSPIEDCPECGGSVYRVIKPVGHILKGSGFYKTDYRSDDYVKEQEASKPKVETGSKSSEKKAESDTGSG